LILFVLIEFCEKEARCMNENHWQVCNAVGVVAHPSFHFFIFDELDDLPSKLEQEVFAGCDIDHSELNTTDICASHRYLLHVVNLADPLDERRDLASVLFDDAPIELVSLLIHFRGRF